MKKFKFDLEDVLELRKFREEECMLALGQAISYLNKIENDILQTAVKKHNASSQRFNNVEEIISWENYIARLDKEMETLTEKAAKAQMVVEEKRTVYLEAEKEVKVMEELKDIQKKEYRKDMQNKEFSEVDELNASRFNLAGKLI
ncbi:MAG: flagellar export protein FliJ [Treponema sp.]|jgi:flagellar FliJ protein|nr:flagellar export protein FliJ [Treponema sp.]